MFVSKQIMKELSIISQDFSDRRQIVSLGLAKILKSYDHPQKNPAPSPNQGF